MSSDNGFVALAVAVLTVSDTRNEDSDTSGRFLVEALTAAGFSGRDSTPEAVSVLFDKQIDGFGEVFRALSLQEIGSSTIQSRALAGLANNTVIFCVPGSTGACKTAWQGLISEQLDSRHRPCNFVGVLKTRRDSRA